MNYELRKAKRTDLEKLLLIQKEIIIKSTHYDSSIKKNTTFVDIKKLILSKQTNFLVIELNKEIICCGYAEIRKSPNYMKPKNYGYIGMIFVSEKHRKKGLATNIINNLVKWLETNKIKEIRLEAYTKNEDAIKLFRKTGFEELFVTMKKV
ncbi:GNAT family N-acetyltransferase [Candidatus Woesearchaeota archaeon]|nr:GNAT family N-acetyltransferase [Candidatus Woesearchaeota archaeon]